ncbi:MAG: MetS family NSS transporter small subunit [Firmicutes bacterium]|nr:MetS family NSS transporter small subunit [Bacillota bacterium]
MEASAWIMLGVAVVLLYGGLAWGITVAVKSSKK